MYTVNLLSNDLLFGIYIDSDLTRPCQYYSIYMYKIPYFSNIMYFLMTWYSTDLIKW